ncbi:hypothetical protein HYT45_02260 [Candidatus Uhrbacteria bacterium]|nr:hypothetical protein [Candidatus Uhrbacteria bacterium]
MKLEYSEARAKAPASIANLGPGFDRVGLSFPYFWDVVSVKANSRLRGVVLSKDSLLLGTSDNPAENIASIAVKVALDALAPDWEKSIGIEVGVWKGVPAGYGLGSSAASAVAGLVSASALVGKNQAFNKKLNAGFRLSEAVKLAGGVEAVSSGVAHYDNAAASLLGGFTSIISEDDKNVRAKFIHDLPDWGIAVFTPPFSKESTKSSREILPQDIGFWFEVRERSAKASLGLIEAISHRDFDEFVSIVESDELVTPKRFEFYGKRIYAKAVAVAKSAAKHLGAKAAIGLSGAGPSLFVVAESYHQALMIAAAMASAFGRGNAYGSQFSSAGAKLLGAE